MVSEKSDRKKINCIKKEVKKKTILVNSIKYSPTINGV